MDHDEAVDGAKSVAVALTKELPGLGTALNLIAAGRDAFLTTGTQRLNACVQAETLDAVLRQLPEVERRVEQLEQAGVAANVADFVHVANGFAKAWSTAADPKKRKILEDAFVRSFDRELYESGLLNALWERLERLSYGDLDLLRDLVEATNFQRLHQEHGFGGPSDLAAFHASNLVREGLAWAYEGFPTSTMDFRATELGRRMRDLAWAQLPDPDAEAADAEVNP